LSAAAPAMPASIAALNRFYCAALLIGGLLWALDVPSRLGYSLIEPEWLGPYLGLATAAAFLQQPYRRVVGALEVVLGLISIASWLWLAVHYGKWLFDVEGYTVGKVLPGVIALSLMTEAIRKSCGLAIGVLVVVMIVYGLVGFALPQPLQADHVSPQFLVMYLYSDTNAVPGSVLGIVATVVLAFIVFGKLMEVSGATGFFTDAAMSLMGHRRGGTAKIAVTASALMGSITGSPVSNIMSTGVVTIPLMKRTGYSATQAAAIEAVASTGGQITPPIMGATAFLMAEFLQVDYSEIAVAAAVPALFFYMCLFMQVDAMAARRGLAGLPKSELPRFWPALRLGWIFVLPLATLIYLLFFAAYSAQFAALACSLLLLVLALLRGRLRSAHEWSELIFDGGANLVPLILIGGAAGVIDGIMNATGLGQSLSYILVLIGSQWGLFATLLLTATLSIVLGLGMPSTAIYVLLASVIAPALVEMGVTPLGAHLFIFYFGVMSFLTPPVAVSSYVAAGIAQADMWRTGWVGMQLSGIACVLPFLWVYDPALLLQGSVLAIAVVTCTTFSAILLIASAIRLVRDRSASSMALAIFLCAAVAAVGTSPIWLGHESMLALAAAAAGVVLYWVLPRLFEPTREIVV
jgi:TRAP transporter 4TM/12TM fusion protein